MKILFLDQYSDPGGAQQVLLELLPAIRERGWHATVGLPGNGKLFETIAAERITYSPAPIRRLVERARPDVVYINGPRLLPAAAIAGISCPVIFHSHNWLPAHKRAVAKLALRRLNAHIVANCRFVAEQWDSAEVIYNGVAGVFPSRGRGAGTPACSAETLLGGVGREESRPSSLKAAPHRRAGPVVGCIGRISPEKGQREFVAVAAQIHHALPEYRFAIYGEPLFGKPQYTAEVRAAAAGLPIEFRGWAPDVYAVLAELDLLLVPSIGPEATTRVIPEAFAAGVPVIAFDTGGIAEVVEGAGILTHSVEEMARESVALLGDRARRVELACAGRAAWETRFTLAKFHDRLLRLIASHQRQPLAAVVANEIR